MTQTGLQIFLGGCLLIMILLLWIITKLNLSVKHRKGSWDVIGAVTFVVILICSLLFAALFYCSLTGALHTVAP